MMLFNQFMKAAGYEKFPAHTPVAVLHIDEVRTVVAKYAAKAGGDLAFFTAGTKLIENYDPKAHNFNKFTHAVYEHFQSADSPVSPTSKNDSQLSPIILESIIRNGLETHKAELALAEKTMEAVRVLYENARGPKIRIGDESAELVRICKKDNSMTQEFFRAYAPDMGENSREKVKTDVLMQIIHRAKKVEHMMAPGQQVA